MSGGRLGVVCDSDVGTGILSDCPEAVSTGLRLDMVVSVLSCCVNDVDDAVQQQRQ